MNGDKLVPPPNNAVRLTSNGVILLVRSGYQTPESMDDFRKKIEKLIFELRAKNQKVYILIDDSRVTGFDKKVRPKLIKFMREIDFDAVAVYGLSPLYRFLTDRLITINRQKTRVRTFDNRRGAAQWLAHYIVFPRLHPPAKISD